MNSQDPSAFQDGRIITDTVREHTIVDTDFHLELPEDCLLPYVEDAAIRRKIERFGIPDGLDSPTGTIIGYANHDEDSRHHLGEAETADEIHQVMGDFGIDAVTVTPTNHLPVGTTNYPAVSTAVVRAYNDYVREKVLDPGRGIYANFVIPHWNPETAVAEIERVGDVEGFVGGYNYTTQRLWGNQQYDPIFSALTERDLPLVMHIGSLSTGSDLFETEMRTWVESVVSAWTANQVAHVTNLIVTGVFDKFPDLNVVYLEAGNQWIPLVSNQLDDLYQVFSKDIELVPRLRELDQDYLGRMPSEYVYDNVYASTQPIALPRNGPEAEAILTACHADETFVFSTDWPHHATDVTTWPFNQPGLDADTRERILWKNAQEVYRLPESLSA